MQLHVRLGVARKRLGMLEMLLTLIFSLPQSSSAYLSSLYGVPPAGAFPHQHLVSALASPYVRSLLGHLGRVGMWLGWAAASLGCWRRDSHFVVRQLPSLCCSSMPSPAAGAGGCELVHPNPGSGGHHWEEGAAHQAAGTVCWRLYQGEQGTAGLVPGFVPQFPFPVAKSSEWEVILLPRLVETQSCNTPVITRGLGRRRCSCRGGHLSLGRVSYREKVLLKWGHSHTPSPPSLCRLPQQKVLMPVNGWSSSRGRLRLSSRCSGHGVRALVGGMHPFGRSCAASLGLPECQGSFLLSTVVLMLLDFGTSSHLGVEVTVGSAQDHCPQVLLALCLLSRPRGEYLGS